MSRSFWQQLSRSRSVKASATRRPFRPALLRLEDRVVPATVFYSNLNDSGAGSLRDAINMAAFGDTVAPNAALAAAGGTINLQTQLSNTGFKALTITGALSNPLDPNSAPNILLNGTDPMTMAGVRIFKAVGNENVSFLNLGFVNGKASGTAAADKFGGALATSTNHRITFTNCIFTNNHADTAGGAIDAFSTNGTIVLNHCTFTGNTAGTSATTGNGGAIVLNDGYTATITNSTFTSNTAGAAGGAIDAVGLSAGRTLTITGSTFRSNSIAGGTGNYGGAVEVSGYSVLITGTTFDQNSAGRAGGLDLFANQTGYAITFTLTGDIFTANTAQGSGGLIVSLQSGSSDDIYSATLNGCTFDRNVSTGSGASVGYGGGANFYINSYGADLTDAGSGTITVTNTAFTNNTSALYGSAFAATAYAYYAGNAAITVDGATITGNRNTGASGLGALYLQTRSFSGSGVNARVTLENSELFGNSNPGSTGGAIYVTNESKGSTGGAETDIVQNLIGEATVANGNSAGLGGGIFVTLESDFADPGTRSTVVIANDTIANNRATLADGGGVYVTKSASSLGTVAVQFTSLTVVNNSAAGSGGGIFIDPSVDSATLDNSIVSLNTPGGDVSGTYADSGYNLIGASAAALNLGPLQNNGGPTRTYELLAGSVAIGAGDPLLGGTLDQRGATRGGPPSIGAYDATLATQLLLIAPSTATAGTAFDVTVVVADQFGKTVYNFGRTIGFYTDTDPSAVFPINSPYTFTAADAGSHTFSSSDPSSGGVTFFASGAQNLYVFDSTGTISGLVIVTI